MKAIFLNGSPRKNWNTSRMLDSAMQGAADAGFEVERVNLFDYEFTGCKSCFASCTESSFKSLYDLLIHSMTGLP